MKALADAVRTAAKHHNERMKGIFAGNERSAVAEAPDGAGGESELAAKPVANLLKRQIGHLCHEIEQPLPLARTGPKIERQIRLARVLRRYGLVSSSSGLVAWQCWLLISCRQRTSACSRSKAGRKISARASSGTSALGGDVFVRLDHLRDIDGGGLDNLRCSRRHVETPLRIA
jgi:hypothetical protein